MHYTALKLFKIKTKNSNETFENLTSTTGKPSCSSPI